MKRVPSLILAILIFGAGMARAETAEEWYEKGVAANETGYYTVAMKCFEKAIVLNPNHAKSHHAIGLLYSKKGKTKKGFSYRHLLKIPM